MIYGYARVSSKEQSLERQIKILRENGVDKKNIYKEIETGKSFLNRIEYKRLLDVCSVGDVIVFTALDRFSRNINEAIKQLEILEKRGIKAKFIQENINTEMDGIAKLIISVFMWVAEQERLTLLERQRQGYKALKKDEKGRMVSNKTGKPVGRQEIKLTAHQVNMIKDFKLGKSEYNITEIAKLIGVSRPYIYKKLKELDTVDITN
jgi:DNA invertase Pin-like site-specific DNA recombinase